MPTMKDVKHGQSSTVAHELIEPEAVPEVKTPSTADMIDAVGAIDDITSNSIDY